MISAKTILNYLPSYRGDIEVIKDNQDVSDIMQAMQNFHKKYAKDYDKIYQFFLGKTPDRTLQKIFDFLKTNCSYYIEGLEGQTVRNPSAILATGKLDGIDCKNFALFIGGILDAINRSGKQNIPFAYRFAQTDLFDENYNHVFIVAYPKTNREIFVDPIPEVKTLDERFPIYSYTDKNYKAMLYGVSGKNRIGDIANDYGTLVTGGAAAAAQGGLNPVADFAALQNIGTFLSNLFSKKGSPNDWKGWGAQDASYGEKQGFSAASWTMKDGDSVQNEALNIVQWIKNYGLGTVLQFHKGLNVTPTINDLVNKLTRGGFGTEAQQFLTAYRSGAVQTPATPLSPLTPANNSNVVVLPVTQDNNGKYWDAQNKEVTKNADGSYSVATTNLMGMNIWVTLALVGAVIFAVNKMK